MPRTQKKPNKRPSNGSQATSSSRRSAPPGEVLTLAETAAYLRATEQDVLRLVQEQGFPGRKVGDDWRFLQAAVKGWLGTPAGAGANFWQAHFGSSEEDPYRDEMLKEIYRRRGRPETDES